MSPMSEISSTISPISTTAQRRKIKKPLIEKRRRLRINQCLSNLKSLVLEATNKDENCFPKMEKADILEMTVAYMKTMKPRTASTGCISPDSADSARTYLSGFRECAVQVCSFFVDNSTVAVGGAELRGQLTRHLSSCFQRIQLDLQRQVDQSAIYSSSSSPGQDLPNANKMADRDDQSPPSPCRNLASPPPPLPPPPPPVSTLSSSLPVPSSSNFPTQMSQNFGISSSGMALPLPLVSSLPELSRESIVVALHHSNPTIVLPNGLLPQLNRSSATSIASILSQYPRSYADHLSPKKADEFPAVVAPPPPPSFGSPSLVTTGYNRSSPGAVVSSASSHEALPAGHAQSTIVWRPW